MLCKNQIFSTLSLQVTVCWLEQSIEQEILMDPNSSFLFRPILIPNSAKPLENCVVTISQCGTMEREHLFHLAEILGEIN